MVATAEAAAAAGSVGSAAVASGTTPATQEPAEPIKPTFTEVDAETFGKLHQIQHVLERWEISGINRKLQLKPRKWEEVDASTLQDKHDELTRSSSRTNGGSGFKPGTRLQGGPVINKDTIGKGAMSEDTLRKGAAPQAGGATGDGEKGEQGEGGVKGNGKVERATQLLLILKWGGELTNLGQRQAIELGNSFRTIMYPDSGAGGLLRLHRCVCTFARACVCISWVCWGWS